ncbi:hypothetical protein ACFVUY_36510 [Kitasatospora sp. NPDC058063]|uniref:hypothetical protein n=1 Tax=unclassified Kitasatospora TaxID=2633591 RepID=UPI0036DC62C6
MAQEAESAAQALTEAERLGRAVKDDSAWQGRYSLVFSCASAAAVLGLGAFPTKVAALTVTGLWVAFVAGISAWSARRPVSARGFGTRHVTMIVCWALVYVAVLVPGLAVFRGQMAWWVPGAVAVALPGIIVARLDAAPRTRAVAP